MYMRFNFYICILSVPEVLFKLKANEDFILVLSKNKLIKADVGESFIMFSSVSLSLSAHVLRSVSSPKNIQHN